MSAYVYRIGAELHAFRPAGVWRCAPRARRARPEHASSACRAVGAAGRASGCGRAVGANRAGGRRCGRRETARRTVAASRLGSLGLICPRCAIRAYSKSARPASATVRAGSAACVWRGAVGAAFTDTERTSKGCCTTLTGCSVRHGCGAVSASVGAGPIDAVETCLARLADGLIRRRPIAVAASVADAPGACVGRRAGFAGGSVRHG